MLMISRRVLYRKIQVCGGVLSICMVLLGVTYMLSSFVEASSRSPWLNGQPIVTNRYEEVVDGVDVGQKPYCENTKITILDQEPSFACITKGSDFIIDTRSDSISFDEGVKYYPIYGIDLSELVEVGSTIIPGSNTLVDHPSIDSSAGWSNYKQGLTITRDFRSKLAPIYGDDALLKGFNYTHMPDKIFSVNGRYWDVNYSYNYSDNGDWIVQYFKDVGVIRINTKSYEAQRISTGNLNIGNMMKFGISDDGKTIIARGIDSRIYQVTANCGDLLDDIDINDPHPLQLSCPNIVLDNGFYSAIGLSDAKFRMFNVKFNSSANEMKILANTYSSGDQDQYTHQVWITINAPGVRPDSSLEYLAIGDSYSSGEGDTEKNSASGLKFYRSNTDVEQTDATPREKCHISSRSYPYILAKWMALGDSYNNITTKWQSIACSGATAWDVKYQGSDDYIGQNNRLEGYEPGAKKIEALNEFIPGRQKQIEFVKKYKPKVVTLTAGGNDIGFGDKVRACAVGNFNNDTCRYAVEGEGRSNLKAEILNQYENLKSLYLELASASDFQAKIYVLGYPQFINGNPDATCSGSNILQLNGDERKMIFHSIEYLNNVIEQASRAAGVFYVDTETSLGGHRLCDAEEKYVTGIAALGSSENQESFHPNAKGHFEISKLVKSKIGSSRLDGYDVCPTIDENVCPDQAATKDTIPLPTYFQSTDTGHDVEYKKMTSGAAVKSKPVSVTVEPYAFKPVSVVKRMLYSEPIDLGGVTTTNNGGVTGTLTIPAATPVGYHTLVLMGESYTGEPVSYEQIILVKGPVLDDQDENGVLDSNQVCGLFIVASAIDRDYDGIDDACDVYVSNEILLYRVRMGDPSRSYIGSSEKRHYIYVERNLRAANISGITGDSDPDGDGWAIVAASKGVNYTVSTPPDTGPVARLVTTGAAKDTKPIVYIRAGGWGCVAFTPTSLARVQAGKEASRTLKKIESNSSKCRQELPSDDVDGNSIPDDMQMLYTAGQGRVTHSEDPARIYVYRNFHATEAKLGFSDYSPTGTAGNTIAAKSLVPSITSDLGRSTEPIQDWNLLAVSKVGEYIPNFNKIAILTIDNEPMPVIITKKQNGLCVAYRPENLDIIKFNTKDTRKLVKLPSLPLGASCE